MSGDIKNQDPRDYDPLPLISSLNLVLQKHASKTGVRVGKNRYFFPSSRHAHVDTGLIAVQGFYASVRPTFNQLMVNVNVCMTAFYKPGSLLDILREFNQKSHGALPTLPKSFAKEIKVTTKHLGYKMKRPLKSISNKSAHNTFFDFNQPDGTTKRISVEEYFKRQYNITLMYADSLPVVDIGSANRNNWIPAELCEIEAGQPFRGKLSNDATRNMIKYACNPPGQNAHSIVNTGLPTLGFAGNTSTLDAFGIGVSKEMTVIPARQLFAPTLSYKSGKPKVSAGSWNILDVKFQRPARVNSWWVLVVQDMDNIFQKVEGPPHPELKKLVIEFSQKCQACGMDWPKGMPTLLYTDVLPDIKNDPGRQGALAHIKSKLEGERDASKQVPSFVLVLLAGRDNFIYPGIKRMCDVELGIHTVTMLISKKPKSDQYLSNVALKVNTKLGGNNHHLDAKDMQWLTKKKTMMVGMDVTHPGPDSREGAPSIAAVVANTDDTFMQFPASLRVQTSRQEMIDDLDQIMVERLTLYKQRNKVLPEKIIIFRDGVSEGQFDKVNAIELPQIIKSFRSLTAKAPHEALLGPFATEAQKADAKGNTRPGTVVDKGITAVYDFDFYLQAHAGLQGTVRPTHYTVVYGESKLGADELQQGTNNASYLYARATKAVSLIPPAYYADVACERGRCYLNDLLTGEDSTSSGGRTSLKEAKAEVFADAVQKWGAGVHPNLRDSMFYI